MMTLSPCTGLLALLLPFAAEPPQFPPVETFGPGAAQRWNVIAGTWDFADGRARQTAPDFDCGAVLKDARPTGPYYLAVRFRPDGDFNGGGLFFALPTADKKAGGMLVRCDPGGRILWGWFDAGGAFNYYADATYDDDGDAEQTLAVAVDPGKQGFNIYHHGERIATNVRTFHTEGFVGIQSSGGPHTFLRVELRPATPDELAGIKPPGQYSGLVDVLGDAQRVLVLRRAAEFLVSLDAQGRQLSATRVADVKGRAAGDFQPVALAWDAPAADAAPDAPRGVLVLAEAGAALYRFVTQLKQIGDGPLLRDAGMKGMGVAVAPTGHILISDESIPGIRVLDAAGRELLKFGERGDAHGYGRPDPKAAGKFKQPRGIALGPDGTLVVMDRGNYTYVAHRYDADANRFEWVTQGPWLPMVDGVRFDRAGRLILAGLFEFYRSYGAVRVMTLDGLGWQVFTGAALGDLTEKVRAAEGPGGLIYVADPDKDRILVLPPNFVEPLPRFAWTPDGGVQLTLTKADGTITTAISRERNAKGDRIVVRPTEPPCTVWPAAAPADLRAYELPPPPPAGQKYVIDMPVLVAVFTKAKDEKGQELRVAAAPDAIIARLERELAVDRYFYWLSSHAILNKQFEYMVIDDAEAEVRGGWIEPTAARTLVNQARQKRGWKPLSADHSLVGIHPMEGFDVAATDDPGYVGGGGLTPYAYSGYGLWNHGQAWLMAHEWGHQLDAYFEKSGFTDWWLNHPDATVHIGRYGEHWDCNAFLCRRADALNWLRFKFGTLRLVADDDGDGLPDADPTLPLDEQRFGSDPTRPDTDGDGLNDLAELCAGTFTSSDPRNADTDGDGQPDARDPYPQFAVRTTITAAGSQPPATVGRIVSSWADATIRAAWQPDAVTYEIELAKPARTVYLPMDWNNDGWFTGFDQTYTTIDLEWRDGAAEIKRAGECTAEVATSGGRTVLQVVVPRPAARVPLAAGARVGLIPRLQNGGGTVAFLIDPWQILGVELK